MQVTEPFLIDNPQKCISISISFLLYPVNLYFKFIFIDKLITHEMSIAE